MSVEGRSVVREPYSKRRKILEEMRLDGPRWHAPEAFDDGQALWAAVCEHELEGVVAKRRSGRYLSGERGWVKVKNRGYWRYELERESSMCQRVSHRPADGEYAVDQMASRFRASSRRSGGVAPPAGGRRARRVRWCDSWDPSRSRG